MLTKCGCAIYVHLQLDLLKFYLAILKSRSLVSVTYRLAHIIYAALLFILYFSACVMNHMFINAQNGLDG